MNDMSNSPSSGSGQLYLQALQGIVQAINALISPLTNVVQKISGISVLGNSGTAAATAAPIVGTAAQVFRVNDAGTALAFGQVDLAQSAAITGLLPLTNIMQGISGYGLFGNGASASSYQGFLQSGASAVTRTWQSKARDWVSALDFAVGDGVTDDSTAIQNAINSLTNGGTVFFPPAPGGFYAIGSGTAITLPTGKAVTLIGAGRGDGAAAVLKATASITSVIGSGTVFIRGHRISSMQIDGNNNAQYCLKMDLVSASLFDNLSLYNATTINFRLGDGTHATQENIIFSVRLDNPLTTVLANLPTYNLEVNGTNNDCVAIKCANAKTANFHSGSTSAGNKYVNLHGYDFFSGAAQAPVNNFLVDGNQEQFMNWECDGSSSANIQVNGFNNTFVGGNSQFASPLTAQKGIQFANATGGNVAIGNTFANSTQANTIVQAGAAAAQGNWWDGCYNLSQGTFVSNKLDINAAYSKQVPTTGFTITVTNAQSELILDPAGTLATGTVNLPSAPSDGQTCRISSTQTVTALTMGGGTIKNALTTIAAGGAAAWRYAASNTTWYRIQ